MHPSIFGKHLEDVTYEDVVTFCQDKHRESLGLDYKENLDSLPKIVKTLVSFANTNGGWLIIGVGDDGNDAPALPIVGMPNKNRIEQVINSSIIDSVTPFIFPLIKKCVSNDGNTMLIVVYMPQSPDAPHHMRFKNRNALFIRRADRTSAQEWEKDAEGWQWELLRNRRQLSQELSSQLMSRMKRVFASVYGEQMRGRISGSGNNDSSRQYRRALTIALRPMYPHAPFVPVKIAQNALSDLAVANAYTLRHVTTPDQTKDPAKTYQTGAYITGKEEKFESSYFFGLDTYGNILNVDPMVENNRHAAASDTTTTYSVKLIAIIAALIGCVRFACCFYERHGLIGNLEMKVNLAELGPLLLNINNTGLPFYEEGNEPFNITGNFSINRSFDTTTLKDNTARHQLIVDILQEILYSFNYSLAEPEQLLQLVTGADHR